MLCLWKWASNNGNTSVALFSDEYMKNYYKWVSQCVLDSQ